MSRWNSRNSGISTSWSKSWTRTRRSILTLVTLTSAALAAPAAAENPWRLIESIGFKEHVEGDMWRVEKTFPPALVAAAEAPVTFSGYYVPIQAQAQVTNFLVVPDPAACPFCGSGGYGVALEVITRNAVPDMPEATGITVTGRLELVDDPETYQSVRLVDAVLGTGS